MHSSNTLQLNDQWDICLDLAGKLALLKDEQAVSQNVANECRLFTQDAYFAFDRGIPHFLLELGQNLSQSTALRAHLRRAAMSVDDVEEVLSIQLDDLDPISRRLKGVLDFSLKGGANVQVDL